MQEIAAKNAKRRKERGRSISENGPEASSVGRSFFAYFGVLCGHPHIREGLSLSDALRTRRDQDDSQRHGHATGHETRVERLAAKQDAEHNSK